MNFNLHFGELHSINSINDKNNLFENYNPKCHKVKRILISFNCLSEYSMFLSALDRVVSPTINIVFSSKNGIYRTDYVEEKPWLLGVKFSPTIRKPDYVLQ